MVLLVSPWHSFEHTQYSTLGFTPKSQNRANVVAEGCYWRKCRNLTHSENWTFSESLDINDFRS